MLTLLCLISVVVFLGLHEHMAARAGTARSGRSVGRRILLLGLLAFAVAFGARAELSTRVRSALDSWRNGATTFEMSGDPYLERALATQQPERAFPEKGTVEDLVAWQTHVRDALRLRAEFSSNPATTVSFDAVESQEIGNVRRTFVEFRSWDGTRIPGYIHQPVQQANGAAVLVIPGHGAGIRATAGIGAADYQQALALKLAERGYTTLTPELRGFGLLAPSGTTAHGIVSHAALEAGSFYKAVVARDLQLALSVLQKWKGVNPSRLAVVGASLGGELAVFLGALDSRVQVIVSHSYGGAVGPVRVPDPDSNRRPPHGCHTIPGINRILYQEDWFRLLAPRAVQVIRGEQNNPGSISASRFEAKASNAFERLGARDRFEFSIQPGRHEFFLDLCAAFLAKWL